MRLTQSTYLTHPAIQEGLDRDPVTGLVADGVADADLEHKVGELLEAILVEMGVMPTECIVGCFPRQPDELLAAEAVLLERLSRGLHADVYRRGALRRFYAARGLGRAGFGA